VRNWPPGTRPSRKGKENPLFQKVLTPRKPCPTRGQWHNDYTVDFKMAYDHYFPGKAKGLIRRISAIQPGIPGPDCFKASPEVIDQLERSA
jgi:hypothetical protein